ncbi:MAG TPA: ATP-binding protein, partial [Acidimicrobiia bacterium]|nr:ATP-binding protein [Acidimicrobiia bacterium]
MNSSPVSPANWESIRIQIDKNEVQTKNNFKKIDSKKVLVACSGGADSVALAILCRTFDIDFGVAYIDHGINVETQNSEIVVKELATICDVPFFTSYLDLADNNMVNSNVEAVARDQRYKALEAIRVNHGYDLVATA